MMDSFRKITRETRKSIKRRTKRFLNEKRSDAKHLFLLSPPLCGSTVIAQIMRTSPKVTAFPGNAEGQYLPQAREILLVDERWNPNLQIDWALVRKIFLQHWSPLKPIRFEKSPPLIARASDLERTFENAFFLITIRNPYAQIEGMLRRKWTFNEYGPQSTSSSPPPLKAAAEFWIRAARYQIRNMNHLQRSCFFSYEELTETTDETIRKILNFLPELSFVDIESTFTAHNVTGKAVKGLKNFNKEKIDKLSKAQIEEINQQFPELFTLYTGVTEIIAPYMEQRKNIRCIYP